VALASRLAELAIPPADLATLESEPARLGELLRTAGARHGPILLVIDQFGLHPLFRIIDKFEGVHLKKHWSYLICEWFL
jgi:hypothetical protein